MLHWIINHQKKEELDLKIILVHKKMFKKTEEKNEWIIRRKEKEKSLIFVEIRVAILSSNCWILNKKYTFVQKTSMQNSYTLISPRRWTKSKDGTNITGVWSLQRNSHSNNYAL